LHEDVGNVLEELYSDQTEEIAVQLARHFEEAGVEEKARHYLKQAGERARRQYANEEAVNYLSRALALTPEADHARRYALLLEREITARDDRRLTRLLRTAKLSLPAAVEDIDFRTPRGLDRSVILRLAGCQWIRDHDNVLVSGATGTGKSYLDARDPGHVMSIQKDGTWVGSTAVELADGLLLVTFGGSGARAKVRVRSLPGYLTLELITVSDHAITPVRLEEAEITRATVCVLDGENASMVEYEIGGVRLAHYRIPHDGRVAPQAAIRVELFSESGVQVARWHDGQFENALVAELPAERLARLAEERFVRR
jgi:hypothetical protein